jgi:hypothetical protein
VVLARHPDRGRLRSYIPLPLIEAHLIADLQPIKTPIDHAVAMEIDLPAIIGPDASEILPGYERDHPSMGWGLMGLYFMSKFVSELPKLPFRGRKGIANRHVHLLMGVMLIRLPARHQFPPSHRDIDTRVEQIALLVVPVAAFHHHTTAGNDIREQLLQFCHMIADIGFHRIRVVHIAESEL